MVWCGAPGVGAAGREGVELEGEPSSQGSKLGEVSVAAGEKAGVDGPGDRRRGGDGGEHVDAGYIGHVTLVQRPPCL